MANQRLLSVICLFLLCVGLAGCLPESSTDRIIVAITRTRPANTVTAVSVQPSQEPAPEPTNTPPPSPTTTPTQTPQATQTPVPPTATPIPTAVPTKPWLIQLSYYGGDGGTSYDKYFGSDLPEFILFDDGQTLIRDRNDISNYLLENEWYIKTNLSGDEIQELFAQIENAGFFEKIQEKSSSDANWLYNFDETTEFSDGAESLLLCISFGDEMNCTRIYVPYTPYLIPEIANSLSLIQNFHPEDKVYSPYEPETMILWVELMQDNIDIGPEEVSQAWPEELPAVSQLMEQYPSGIVLLHGDEAMTFFTFFGSQIDDGIFTDDGMEYYMISRPLLPSEAPDRFRPPNVTQ